MVKGYPDNTEYGDVIVWLENKTFWWDFFKYIWDRWKVEKKKDLYLIVQYLELKEGVKPTMTGQISRRLIEEEYILIGYATIKMNDEFGKFYFGTYTVPLYEGPVYVEECLP